MSNLSNDLHQVEADAEQVATAAVSGPRAWLVKHLAVITGIVGALVGFGLAKIL